MEQRAERGEATRRKILAAATRLFAEQGYDAVSIDAVQRETGVSRGSLYHHFSGKEALFTAALEETEARVAAIVMAAAQHATSPLEAMRLGCGAWIDLAADDDAVKQIALIDAPSVVGWDKWREIDSRYGFGLLLSGLEAVAATGQHIPDRVALFAHALLAVLSEMALVVARAKPGDGTDEAARAVVDQMLDRLFGGAP